MKCRTIEINGEEIFYREKGTGPILLLIHGNISSSIFFTEMIEELSKEYRVIAPDLRGYGNSSYNKKINSISEFADDIREFVIELDLKEFYILGWSLGGGIVMELWGIKT
ncbi:alpha/beta fold hydrolase [Peptoniphilus indolicus]|uniref:Non-heme chloroperoxidase n=1 Tax=Peptoniphilus indolicus TaxID=33030 RepID=A0A379EFA4_9FIRM|nr:alpha/beta hydrolase [Peptoniphilus indolicus]SUB94792.1 Non-heme chloroperoxidase [Peptoniphilus indolicus]